MAVTRPISIRLDPEVDASVRRLAHRTRRPLGRVVNELLDQSLRMQRFPGISFAQSPVGATAHLMGTGLDVWEVVALARAYPSRDELLSHHGNLTEPLIEIALAYADAYPDEIEREIEENERPVEDVIREYPSIRSMAV